MSVFECMRRVSTTIRSDYNIKFMGPIKAFKRFLRNRNKFYKDFSSFKKGALLRDLTYFKEWFGILRSGKSPIDLELPWITLPATHFLRRVIQPGMKIFEWGCGG